MQKKKNPKKTFAHYPTHSAIPDNYDKILISHMSEIFKRGQLSNPTSSVENRLFEMDGFMGRSRSSRIQRYLSCYVQQHHLVDAEPSCAVSSFLCFSQEGETKHISRVQRICSDSDKFHFKTINSFH